MMNNNYSKNHSKKFIEYMGKRVHVSAFNDREINLSVYKEMRMNSYAQDEIFTKLNDEALIDTARHFLSQCSHPRTPCATYDEALIHKIVPELLKRLEGM